MSKDAAMLYAIAALGLAELTDATRLDRVAPPLANLVISNVPGAREPMYLNGAALVGTFPISAHRHVDRPQRDADFVSRPHGLRLRRQRRDACTTCRDLARHVGTPTRT